MHSEHQSDAEEVRKNIPKYLGIGAALLVFTGITVGVNEIHLSSVPLAITIALIVASIKGSMVTSVFMHLNHERKWIYGCLILTVVLFIPLMFLPILTQNDHIGKPTPSQMRVSGHEGGAAAGGEGH
jgi:caa(3)-type oxidase subunit IV